MLGKVWTGIKWGAIGAGLSGLVWLFKEEITKFGDKLKDSVKEFGDFLKDKFQFIAEKISAFKTIYI